jgi:predicted membrane GTPase involved in stress response
MHRELRTRDQQTEIVAKRVDGELMEPVEHLAIDIPEEFVGAV